MLDVELINPTTAIREAAKFNVPDFARALGFSAAYVYRMEETGQGGVSKKFALRLLELYSEEMQRLGITVEDLLRGTATPNGDSSPSPAPAGAEERGEVA
jgi:hypothetical protein